MTVPCLPDLAAEKSTRREVLPGFQFAPGLATPFTGAPDPTQVRRIIIFYHSEVGISGMAIQ
jgi:hypothetical protein